MTQPRRRLLRLWRPRLPRRPQHLPNWWSVRFRPRPPGRYHVAITEPGIHSFTVRSEATDTLRMEIEPGETYYSECTIGMGIMAGRPNLSPSDRTAFLARFPKLKPAVNK